MPSVCYFEIPVASMSDSQSFYSKLFDWEFHKLENSTSENVDYQMVNTNTPGDRGLPWLGMLQKQGGDHTFTPYIGVDSLDKYLEKAISLGAKVIHQKTVIPDRGYFALVTDPTGNIVGLWENSESAECK